MSDKEEIRSITDATVPNAGRVYDYFLGGNHNFKVDREMAENLIKKMPFIKILAKLIRWFLLESVEKALSYGFTQFIDFASGLPTKDHIHSNTPEGTKVLYSDIDPITVRTAQKMIGDNPNVKYMLCDAAKPKKVLESNIIKDLFGSNHYTAIGLNGICYFLTDEQIKHFAKKLYDWADKGSLLFLCDGDAQSTSTEFKTLMELYKNMEQPIFLRSKETLCNLVRPWRVGKLGFKPLDIWIDSSNRMTEKTIKYGAGGLLGGFFRK